MGMMLTGRTVMAEEGAKLGFVNEVVSGDVVTAAREWADAILVCSPLSVRATKAAVHAGLDAPLPVAIDAAWRHPAVVAMLASDDAREGPEAFTQKRPAVWRGR
ncbi:Carnitinyl-CoA dehydratase [compost metagenome]